MLHAEAVLSKGEELPAPRTLHELRADLEVQESLNGSNGFMVTVPLIVNSGRVKRVSLDFDTSLVDCIDQVSKACNLTRKAWIEQIVRDSILAYETGVGNDEKVATFNQAPRAKKRARARD